MKKSCLTIILCTLALVLSVAVYPKTVQAATIPTFNIVAVEEDKNVTIYTKNFPANKEFKQSIPKTSQPIRNLKS